eukprot:4885121-Prymnesium_polylepis.1
MDSMRTVPTAVPSQAAPPFGLPTRDEVTCSPAVLHGVATEGERCARRERTHSAAGEAQLDAT